MQIINFILHINNYIGMFIESYGIFVYLILFGIIFCETGLVFLPFLPGDSIIFAGGAFAGMQKLNLWVLFIVFVSAAILGDLVNYIIGKKFGKNILSNKNNKLIKEETIQKSNEFIGNYGGRAIFFARFIPIIRTIVPFLIGMGKLEYKTFLKFNVIGAFVWVILFLTIGCLFGNIKFVKDNISIVILFIIFMSVIPIIIEVVKSKRRIINT